MLREREEKHNSNSKGVCKCIGVIFLDRYYSPVCWKDFDECRRGFYILESKTIKLGAVKINCVSGRLESGERISVIYGQKVDGIIRLSY
jgi:hypothetical protein